jgi:hypothetical protein
MEPLSTQFSPTSCYFIPLSLLNSKIVSNLHTEVMKSEVSLPKQIIKNNYETGMRNSA